MSAERTEWDISRGQAEPPDQLEPVRPIPVSGPMGYVDPWGVKPGGRVGIHVSAPAAHRIEVRRLGETSLLDPDATEADDRKEAELVACLECPAPANEPVRPGSYVHVPARAIETWPATVSLWFRLWKLPSLDEVWHWAGLVTEFDFPERCGFAVAVDVLGRIGIYAGDGGAHSPANWQFVDAQLGDRLGEWLHLAVTADEATTEAYLQGVRVHEGPGRPHDSGAVDTVRIAAAAQQGVVDYLLDADVSSVLLTSSRITAQQARRVAEDRTLTDPNGLGLSGIQAYWKLADDSGARVADSSASRCDGQIVNGATLGIPGPAASEAAGGPDYEPAQDPFRGGAIRFSSDDLRDARWPVAAEVEAPPTAESGFYSVRVTLAGCQPADALEIPFVVVRPQPREPDAVVLVVPTFTWGAYARRPLDDCIVPGLTSSFYSHHLNGKPFFHVGMRLPLPRARPFLRATHRLAETVHQHLVRPERLAAAWLRREGYAFELVTDAELDAEPELLERFRALMIVGHHEYWTQSMRDGVESYLADGGDLLALSGNSLFWRVSIDPDTGALEARKTSHAHEQDPWLTPTEWGERWHTDGRPGGTWSLIGQPTGQLLGAETLGWIDSGDAASFAPYKVVAEDHFLFQQPEPVPLEQDGTLGNWGLNGPGASGYEMDGLPEAVGMSAGDTEGRVLLAHADGQHYIECFSDDPHYGGDVIYWERADGGRVFGAASVAYTGTLAVDPGTQALTRNVLHHFGVGRAT